jgi:hypothetical protein
MSNSRRTRPPIGPGLNADQIGVYFQDERGETVSRMVVSSPLALGHDQGLGVRAGGDPVAEQIARLDLERQVCDGLSDLQRSIQPGDWFAVDTSLISSMFGGLIIYGHAFTDEELAASERAAGASEAEIAMALHREHDSRDRGYLFGWCYSAAEPDGEPGATHRSTIVARLTEAEFEAARARGWRLEG